VLAYAENVRRASESGVKAKPKLHGIGPRSALLMRFSPL
jgi:hypothetical protein